MAPHAGQGTEDTCSGVSSDFFTLAGYDNAQSRNCSILNTVGTRRTTSRPVIGPIGGLATTAKCSSSVRNGTAWLPSRCHARSMLYKKRKKEPEDATHASVRKEMAKPRMAKSVRIAELNRNKARIPAKPSTTMPGTVDKIIRSPRPSQPEKAQIAVDGPDHRYRALRIENTLTDENGDEVRLKKGAHVYVTVTAKDANPYD